jgi:hypothetical protein
VGESRTPPRVAQAVLASVTTFNDIRAPALAIIADPQDFGPWFKNNEDPAARATIQKTADLKEKMAKAFENGVPSAHVVRLSQANHNLFASNEADVLREMRAFIATLK